MRKRLRHDQLERSVERLRQQPLHDLKFEDAFSDTLAMMAFMIDMTERFGSSGEDCFSDHCASVPPIERLHGKNFKTRRNKP